MGRTNSKRGLAAALVLACLAAKWTQPAAADTVVLGANRDNTLYEDAAGALSNGSGTGFFAGKNGNGLIRRGLLRFDVAGGIPAGATINSATLTLHMSLASNTISRNVTLHRVLADWGEGASNSAGGGGGSGDPSTLGDATWLHTFFNTATWANPGGDFLATASATAAVAGVADYSWTSPQLAPDVQNWLDTPAANFGWLLRGDESVNSTSKRFDTRENTTAAFRPRLAIDYTPIPEPATWLLAMFSMLGVVQITRKSQTRNPL